MSGQGPLASSRGSTKAQRPNHASSDTLSGNALDHDPDADAVLPNTVLILMFSLGVDVPSNDDDCDGDGCGRAGDGKCDGIDGSGDLAGDEGGSSRRLEELLVAEPVCPCADGDSPYSARSSHSSRRGRNSYEYSTGSE